MSPSDETTKLPEPSLARDVINLVRYYLWRATTWARPYLGGRRGLLLLAVAVLGLGAALNWSWLVAIGVAPVLVALAPCAVMCALGLCMSRMGGKSCSTESSVETADAPPRASAAGDLEGRDEAPAVAPAEAATRLADDSVAGDGRAAAPGGNPSMEERS